MRNLANRLRRTEIQSASHLWLRIRSIPQLVTRSHLVRRVAVRRYLAGATEPRLQIGSGPHPVEGWLNSDLLSGEVYLDLLFKLPLPDESFAYAYGEHVIEHLPEQRGLRALEELHRILRPGGVLRMTTPDLQKIIGLYEDRSPHISRADYARFLDEASRNRHDRACQIFNTFMYSWGHRFIYDAEELTAKLELAGFTDVVRCEPNESSHPALRELERHGPQWENPAEAMCLEATRPPAPVAMRSASLVLRAKVALKHALPTPVLNRILLTAPRLYALPAVNFETNLDAAGVQELRGALRATAELAGDVVECGTSRGGSAVLMARELQALGSRRRVFACDSFEGFDRHELLAERSSGGTTAPDGAFTSTSLDYLRRKLRALGLEDVVTPVPGYFDASLPALEGPFSVAFVDCDLRASMTFCAETLWPRLLSGGRLLFDDYDNAQFPSATQAIEEFAERHAGEIAEHGLLRKLYSVTKA